MAHNITEQFRALVNQNRKEHGDSRRTKLRQPSHLIPGEARVDGAPPFMQAYMKEASTILQHITSLTRMLTAVRRAYLDVHARPPPATRQTVRALDTTGVDAWADIKFFTSAERDQIDMQAQRAERVTQTSNPLYRFLPALLLPDNAITCVGIRVTWYLTRRLTQVSQMQRDMQEERVRREIERTRTLGSGVARELVGMNVDAPQPGSTSWFGSASSALGASWATPQHAPPEELDPLGSDDEDDEVELSASQIQQFEAENAQILRSAEDSLATVQQAEARLLEISALQAELIAQLTRQTEVSDQLYEDAIATSEMVEKGNVQLREARRRARDGRKWLLLFLIGASLSLLFLHYY
ncbi:hypothetical protein EDB92DRAFT_1860741 [Lactarius akahatsu]|uniref:SNARE-complex protein Syntaxin-18 N-terminal domain-containing protein n=1 Tax=Lactarius akahatsu TaxID=416441 RepID=A0AAD4LK45_9AGAM|nr:hypothetical protein EDB92DRAFT_1860741 [Lactarius akahatsu]